MKRYAPDEDDFLENRAGKIHKKLKIYSSSEVEF